LSLVEGGDDITPIVFEEGQDIHDAKYNNIQSKFEFIFITSTEQPTSSDTGSNFPKYAQKFPWVRVVYRNNLHYLLPQQIIDTLPL